MKLKGEKSYEKNEKIIPLFAAAIMVFLAVPVNTQAQSQKAAVNKTINTFLPVQRN